MNSDIRGTSLIEYEHFSLHLPLSPISALLCEARQSQACEMLIVIDETLYVSYGSDVRTVINLVDEHIGKYHLIRFFNL